MPSGTWNPCRWFHSFHVTQHAHVDTACALHAGTGSCCMMPHACPMRMVSRNERPHDAFTLDHWLANVSLFKCLPCSLVLMTSNGCNRSTAAEPPTPPAIVWLLNRSQYNIPYEHCSCLGFVRYVSNLSPSWASFLVGGHKD